MLRLASCFPGDVESNLGSVKITPGNSSRAQAWHGILQAVADRSSVPGYGLFYDLLGWGTGKDQTADAPWRLKITLTTPPGGFTNPYSGYPGGSPFPTPQPPSSNVSFPSQGTYISYPENMHVRCTQTSGILLMRCSRSKIGPSRPVTSAIKRFTF